MAERSPTRIVVTLDEPMTWADAGPLGDAVNAVLGGEAKVKLDRGGRRWTFVSAKRAGPETGRE